MPFDLPMQALGRLGHSQCRVDPLDVRLGMSWMLFLVVSSASRTYTALNGSHEPHAYHFAGFAATVSPSPQRPRQRVTE